MELVIGLLWFSAFSVIVLFLGALNYFLGRSNSDIKQSQSDSTNQQQSNRTINNRKKHARNANKKRQQAAAAAVLKDTSNNDDKQEVKSISTDINNEEKESLIHLTDEEQEEKEEFEDPMTIDEVLIPTVQEEEKPILPVKQRNKNKSNHNNSNNTNLTIATSLNSSKEESILPTKPQACVAPVIQSLPFDSTINIDSNQIPQDKHSKSNGKSSYNQYSYSEHSSVPPRFRQHQQKEVADIQKFRKRQSKKSPIFLDSPTGKNDFIPSISKQQSELIHQSSNQNGYSSESDILTESSSTGAPLSTESQFSLTSSLSPTNSYLDELISIFDTTSFSTDELQLILNKIKSKHVSNKEERQRSLATTTTKNEKTIERILDETYRSQTKILAIELQTEKNRVLELSKMNADMDNTIRQLQQPNNNMIPYQQTILSYQMQIKRITDDNARLIHQLNAYSIMPATINELKQQQAILNDQLRQLTIRNSNLEQEITDGERASKHAAEIYKKGDTQKQERIEQLMIDINKYKKIEKDLSTLQEKHNELEKSLKKKLKNITHERDDLQKSCNELKEELHQNEQSNVKSDQISSNTDQLQQELDEAKAKNDLLRQRNWKIMEQLNKLKHEQES